jgi:SAM-dependent methyltransferase
LLYHLKQQFPEAHLIGWDIFPAILEDCREDPALKGITFEVMDVLDIKAEATADVIILSAVLFRFSDHDHGVAWKQIHKALKPKGHVVVFDFYHEFRQTVRIVDETELHPNGLVINLRSQMHMGKQLRDIGFDSIHFHPFNISLDLEHKEPGDPINTYTRMTKDGHRLQFRGAIYQPWCHMTARKC